MRTKAHWDECKLLASYHAAQSLACQLRDNMKECGNKLQKIKVLSKEEVNRHGGYADAQVVWQEGPIDWAANLAIHTVSSVWAEAENEFTISFYDI